MCAWFLEDTLTATGLKGVNRSRTRKRNPSRSTALNGGRGRRQPFPNQGV